MLWHLTVRSLLPLLLLMYYEYPMFMKISAIYLVNNAVGAAGNVPNDIRYVVIELMELVMFMVMSMC